MSSSSSVTIEMDPFTLCVDLSKTALLVIDMQHDFLKEGGFGALLGNDVSKLARTIKPTQKILQACREAKLFVLHTREGHRPCLSDLWPHKRQRPGSENTIIGREGPFGKLLVRGETCHDIIPEVYPIDGEPVIDKAGKGAFYATDLECLLRVKNIETILVAGVTTEVCVHTTVREANDRGFHCVVLSDCCGSYIDEFHEVGLKMISAQGGLFGSVSDSGKVLNALSTL